MCLTEVDVSGVYNVIFEIIFLWSALGQLLHRIDIIFFSYCSSDCEQETNTSQAECGKVFAGKGEISWGGDGW